LPSNPNPIYKYSNNQKIYIKITVINIFLQLNYWVVR